MTLTFPNQSRSYDAVRGRIRFWGYDSALEIPFFIEASALSKLSSEARPSEDSSLATFDRRLDRIHEVAARVYERHRKGAYSLGAGDF